MESQSSRELIRACAHCGKFPCLCVCDVISKLDNRTSVLILQHPAEQDEELGTARIAQAAFRDCTLKVGLSWRNLSKALGREANSRAWGVLYLGTKKGSLVARACRPGSEVTILSPLTHSSQTLEGIVALDGNWRQAKALWWRNPWLLKLHRIVLSPSRPSLYGKERREPRRESVSTLEAIAIAVSELEGREALKDEACKPLAILMQRFRAGKK